MGRVGNPNFANDNKNSNERSSAFKFSDFRKDDLGKTMEREKQLKLELGSKSDSEPQGGVGAGIGAGIGVGLGVSLGVDRGVGVGGVGGVGGGVGGINSVCSIFSLSP